MPIMTQAEKASYDAIILAKSGYDLVVTDALRKGDPRSTSIAIGDFTPSLGSNIPTVFNPPSQLSYVFSPAETSSITYSWAIPADADLNTVNVGFQHSFLSAVVQEYSFELIVQEVVSTSDVGTLSTSYTTLFETEATGGSLRFYLKSFGNLILTGSPNATLTFSIKRLPSVFTGDVQVVGLSINYLAL